MVLIQPMDQNVNRLMFVANSKSKEMTVIIIQYNLADVIIKKYWKNILENQIDNDSEDNLLPVTLCQELLSLNNVVHHQYC